MGKDNNQKSDIERRLELVRKQFQRQVTEQKKREATEKRERFFRNISDFFKHYRTRILRLVVFIILGSIVLAAILVVILN
jgi:hypothetical protein